MAIFRKKNAKLLQKNCMNENVGDPQSFNQQFMSGQKYSIQYAGQFIRSIRLLRKRGYDESQMDEVIKMLANGEQLPRKFRKHPLHGQYNGYFECHLSDDSLLIWKQEEKGRVIVLTCIGTHTELFDKKRRGRRKIQLLKVSPPTNPPNATKIGKQSLSALLADNCLVSCTTPPATISEDGLLVSVIQATTTGCVTAVGNFLVPHDTTRTLVNLLPRNVNGKFLIELDAHSVSWLLELVGNSKSLPVVSITAFLGGFNR